MELDIKLESMLLLMPEGCIPNCSEFSLLSAELAELKDRLSFLYNDDTRLYPMQFLINFALDPKTMESIQLKKKYEVESRYISNIYSKIDWYDQTLIKLSE